MTFYCKKKWHNPWSHLENVWWLCGTKFFGMLWAEMPLIVSFGKAQIIAYSCVPSPIHLSERIPPSSGLASEEGVFDVSSLADSVPWAAPSWFLTTWPGWNWTGWVRLGIHWTVRDVFSLEWYRISSRKDALSESWLFWANGMVKIGTETGSGSGNSELSRK